MTQETVSPRGGSPAVRAARRDEAALLGEVLADAFAEDPVFAWLISPQAGGRDNRLRTFFTSMSRAYLRLGKPCYLTGDGSAAALWAAPGAWAMPLSQVILEAAPNGLAFRHRLLRALRTQLQIERLHAGSLRRTGTSATSAPAATGRARGWAPRCCARSWPAWTPIACRPTSNPPTSGTWRCMSATAFVSSANYGPWVMGPPSGVCGANPSPAPEWSLRGNGAPCPEMTDY